MSINESDLQRARRDFIKKAAYVAPAIVTLVAAPAYARLGSDKDQPPRRVPGPRQPQPPVSKLPHG